MATAWTTPLTATRELCYNPAAVRPEGPRRPRSGSPGSAVSYRARRARCRRRHESAPRAIEIRGEGSQAGRDKEVSGRKGTEELMPRRARVVQRVIAPDPKFHNASIAKFI